MTNYLKNLLETHNINNWELDSEYVDVIFKAITASDLYTDYMNTKTSDFKEDKDFIVDVFKGCFRASFFLKKREK